MHACAGLTPLWTLISMAICFGILTITWYYFNYMYKITSRVHPDDDVNENDNANDNANDNDNL